MITDAVTADSFSGAGLVAAITIRHIFFLIAFHIDLPINVRLRLRGLERQSFVFQELLCNGFRKGVLMPPRAGSGGKAPAYFTINHRLAAG